MKDALSAFFTRVERYVHGDFPSVTVLAYHAVSSEKTIVDIDTSVFKQQVAFLRNICEFITLDQVYNFIQGKETFSKPAVAFSFDDGYKDVFTNVLPILTK